MVIRCAYLKMVRANQSTFAPAVAVTTQIQIDNPSITPLGGAGTAAPSTHILDMESGTQWFLNKPYSAVHAAMTAVTSANDQINIV